MKNIPFSGILILVSSMIAFAITTGSDKIFIGFLTLLALMSIFIKFRISLSRRRDYIAFLILIVPALLNYFLRPVANIGTAQYSLLQIPAYYAIFLSLFLIYKVKSLTNLLTFYFAAVFILISSGFSTVAYYFDYFIILHLLFASFYFRSIIQYNCKPLSSTLKINHLFSLFFMIILTVAVFFAFNRFVIWLEPVTNSWFIPQTGAGLDYAGFLNETSLNVTGNMKLSTKIVMRIFTSSDVDRVRCKAYTDYLNGKWKTLPERTVMKSISGDKIFPPDMALPYKEIFSPDYSVENKNKICEFRIKLVSGANTVFFIPPSGFALMTDVTQVSLDQYGIFYPETVEMNMDYSVAGLSGVDHVLCPEIKDLTSSLNLPLSLSPKIAGLSEKLTAGKSTVLEKCLSIESYFHREFEYSLDFKPSRPGDPVEEFLLDKRSAHCEYFATAMVILLRSAGIPARYVTGYLVHEYNRNTGYYVVRDRDAHAWVEAFIEGRWHTFDPTPGGGLFNELLGNSRPDILRQIIDLILLKWDELKGFLYKGDISGIFTWLLHGVTWSIKCLFSNTFAIIILIILIIVFRKRFKIPSLRRRKNKITKTEETSLIKRLHDMMSRFDSIFIEKNMKRKENLTLYEYIDLLKENNLNPDELKLSGEFIKKYCILRYGPEEIIEGDFLSLEKKLEELEEISKKIMQNNKS